MSSGVRRPWSWPTLAATLVLQIWLAHAIAFFAHEYAHSFTAWALGWKANPLALDFAKPSLTVVLIQLGINQNVDEARIYAAGRGADAAVIAAAGMVIGNGLLTYPLSLLAGQWALKQGRFWWAMLAFWVTAASVGNLIDYVPIRTFTGGSGDMGSVERGFGWSPWIVMVLLGTPTLVATVHFVLCHTPRMVAVLFPSSPARRNVLAVLAMLFVFAFYGLAGLLEDDAVSQALGKVTIFGVAPLAVASCLMLLRSRSARKLP